MVINGKGVSVSKKVKEHESCQVKDEASEISLKRVLCK